VEFYCFIAALGELRENIYSCRRLFKESWLPLSRHILEVDQQDKIKLAISRHIFTCPPPKKMSFRSKEPHNFLRTKSKKTKPERSDPKPCSSSSHSSSSKSEHDDGSNYVGLGRTGRRNTLPNLFADDGELASMSKDKQKSHEDLKLPSIDKRHKEEQHLPFIDSLIKRKNKLRQSFHGTLSSSLPSSNL
jgi:hypothetical protein